MAGVSIKVTVRDQAVREAFDRLLNKDGGLLPGVLKNIGVMLVKSVRQRFSAQVGPDGKSWAPLNPDYAKGKRGAKILQEQGMAGGLLGSITWAADDRSVQVGTNKVYGAIHQFGGTIVPRSADALVFRLGGRLVHARKVTIPARPYLGVSAADSEGIVQVITDHIEGALEP